jgi:quercetin dioxygenase-like cupin family protein
MKMKHLSLLVCLASTAAFAQGKPAKGAAATPAPAAHAAGHEGHIEKLPADQVWGDAPNSLPPGAKAVLLEGDPSKEGFFAMKVKLPAGYKVPPHFHPAFERLTVLEGTFQLGSGEKWDDAALKSYPQGSYISMPAQMRHYAQAKTETVLLMTTTGPWGITYLNPADDPRTKKAASAK